ncbi:MAG: hypothetical protein WC869_14110 [Phycisphaerae bacterium]|jgi:hypothetical protein
MKKIKPINVILVCAAVSIGIAIVCLGLNMITPNKTLEHVGLAFIGVAFTVAMIPLTSLVIYLGLKKAASKWRQR